MASLKAEFLSHYQDVHGVPLRSRLFGSIRALNRLGSATAPLSNLAPRAAARARGGDRPPPAAAALLARHADPVGQAACAVDRSRAGLPRRLLHDLHRAGDRAGGDRAARGGRLVGAAGERRLLRAVLDLQGPARPRARDGGGHDRAAGAVRRARRADRRLRAVVPAHAARGAPPAAAGQRARARRWPSRRSSSRSCWWRRSTTGRCGSIPGSRVAGSRIVFHGHCHQKALAGTKATVELLKRIPGAEVVELDAGCCGMAGSFGFEAEHYELSMQIGEITAVPGVARRGRRHSGRRDRGLMPPADRARSGSGGPPSRADREGGAVSDRRGSHVQRAHLNTRPRRDLRARHDAAASTWACSASSPRSCSARRMGVSEDDIVLGFPGDLFVILVGRHLPVRRSRRTTGR